MKKSTPFIALFISLFCFDAVATTWRVNNNANINANFTTLQAAVTAAANGDTIIVEPSPNNYGGATITKKLTIIGNGSFLSNYPGLQFNNNSSEVGTLFFQAGSEHSFISGIYFPAALYLQTTNITVHRCRVQDYIYIYSGNLTISESWILNGISQQVDNLINLLYRNNIVVGYTNVLSNSIAVIENNVFGWQGGGGISLGNSYSAVRNNIFPFDNPNNITGAGNADIQNNISATNTLPAGFGNQNSVNMTDVFVVFPFSNATDSGRQLKAGSPAIDAGFYGNGDDIGAYNNGTGRPTYTPALIPPFPTIYGLSVGGGNNNTTLNVTISTRANN